MKTFIKCLFMSFALTGFLLTACSSSDDDEPAIGAGSSEDVYFDGEKISLEAFVGKIEILSQKTPEHPVEVTLSEAGSLESRIAGKDIDALTISGPVNLADMAFIRDYAKSHYLIMLDLENARFDNNAIPDYALSVIEADKSGYQQVALPIFHVRLPKGIKSLGAYSFASVLLCNIELPASLTSMGEDCFAYNYLSSGDIVIPDGVKEIPARAFGRGNFGHYHIGNPEGVGKIVIPASVTKIGYEAFGSIKAKKIILGENVREILDGAFMNNTEVESIVIPKTVKQLFPACLGGLKNLKTIYCLSQNPPEAGPVAADDVADCLLNANAFSGGHADMGPEYSGTPTSVVVYVPVGSAEKYRQAKGWNRFTNFIETSDMPAI